MFQCKDHFPFDGSPVSYKCLHGEIKGLEYILKAIGKHFSVMTANEVVNEM